MCAQRNWDGFTTFHGRLTGSDVRQNYDSAKILNFLKQLNDNPQDHGIREKYVIIGVQKLYKEFFGDRLQIYVFKGVEVQFYKVSLTIFDVDAALGYIFSACPLPPNATAIDTYLPLLAIYCMFMKGLEVGGSYPPTTAYAAVGVPPGSQGQKVIFFGATIRGRSKDRVQGRRLELLKAAFNQGEFQQNHPYVLQKYGHCAETYPYICNIDRESQPRVFASHLIGMAVRVEDVAAKDFEPFAYDERWDHKRACMNCETLLTLGERPPYNCFPHPEQTYNRNPSTASGR